MSEGGWSAEFNPQNSGQGTARTAPQPRSRLFNSPVRIRQRISTYNSDASTPVAAISPLRAQGGADSAFGSRDSRYQFRFKVPLRSQNSSVEIQSPVSVTSISSLPPSQTENPKRSPRTSPRSMSPFPGDFRCQSTPRSQSQSRRSWGTEGQQQFVLGPRESSTEDPMSQVAEGKGPGLYSLTRSRVTSRAVSPIPYGTPLMRQRSVPRIYGSNFRPVATSSAVMSSSISNDSPSNIPQDLSMASLSLASPYDDPVTEMVDHRQRIEDLEQQLLDLHQRLEQTASTEPMDASVNYRTISGSMGALGSRPFSGPSSPTTLDGRESNGYFSAGSSTILPNTFGNGNSHNNLRFISVSQEMLETETSSSQYMTARNSFPSTSSAYHRSPQPGYEQRSGSRLLVNRDPEVEKLNRKLMRAESALELKEACYEQEVEQFRDLTLSQRRQLDHLKRKLRTVELECQGWKEKSQLVEQSGSNTDEREEKLQETREEVEKLRAVCHDLYKEAVANEKKRNEREQKLNAELDAAKIESEALKLSLATRETENAELRAEVELLESQISDAKTPVATVSASETRDLAEKVRECRWMIKCLHDSGCKMVQGETPEMDKLLGIAQADKEWTVEKDREVSEKMDQGTELCEMEALHGEIETVQDLFAKFSAHKVAQEASDSCRIS